MHQPPTRDVTADDLTQAVLASFGGAHSPRFREVAQSLVRHLHAFVADVRLTEREWADGIEFLTRTGHATTSTRQEFVLLSDVLGVSMQVVGMNHPASGGATESTVFGPFFVEGAPELANGADLGAGAPGRPCFMRGRVLSTDGSPVSGAVVDVWQADENGFYDVQYDDLDVPRGRGRLRADGEGRFWFWSVLPVAYPIPEDGPVGDLLRAAGRSPMRPAHVHFMVSAPGFRRLITHIFAAGDEHLNSDAVFGVRSSLVAKFEEHPAGDAPDGRRVEEPWYSMRHDLVLEPEAGAGDG